MSRPTARLGARGLRRVALTVGALGLVAALGATPALAFWSTSGTATAGATARTLATPAAPAVGTATQTSLVVSGTLPAAAAQVTGTAYTVKRGSTTLGCSLPSSGAYSCTDTGLTGGQTYSYTVVATLGAWTAASAATTGSTLCSSADSLAVSAPATVTAGTSFDVDLTRRNCDGSTDTSFYSWGTVTLTGPSASPSGKAWTYTSTVLFWAGQATTTVRLYAAETTAITASYQGITGSSAPITVQAAAARNFMLLDARSKGAAVTLTCAALSDPSTARSCSASNPGQNGNHAWTAIPQLVDTWGNVATTPTALTVTADPSTGANGTVVIPAGSSASAAPGFSVQIGNGATISIAVTAPGLSTLTVTGAR
ncbi:hypothetical protein SAMN04489867_2332 [Pedococcus dokdonensis]|uniref:Fibronectin type-III domain-containing protein n=1 Tax=Pedococcus dokdonensis TaxID=443156 RepID=A0A1H0SFH7_9MICO|nr:hypothetical protein [Pedococcus dokdonensis]SDP40269.1 hypothetical protein SAMN04489867_2332 [Pedococcus dokdonensis]